MMNTKKLLAILVIAIVGLSTMNAQKMDNSKMKKDTTKMEMDHSNMEMKTMYACPMKCEGEKKYEKAGECPKCGMDLKKMKMDQSKMTKVYTCSMHPEVIKDKEGKCPKCGMKLMEKKMKMKKMDKKKEDAHKGHNHQ